MQKYKFEPLPGTDFKVATSDAKEIQYTNNCDVEFNFNGVTCVVTAQTNPEWLYRDYRNSLSYKIPEVATGIEPEYSPEIQEQLNKAKIQSEKRQAEARKKYEAEEKKKLNAFNKKVQGIEIELFNPLSWKMWSETNQDGYGKGIMTFAQNWAKLMQVEMASGKSLKDIASKTSHEADVEGITGYMYGAAVKVLADSWKHGEELRRWHNKEYNQEGDGVVNPAVITLG